MTLSHLFSERHYRVRGKEDKKECFLMFSRVFSCSPRHFQACPLITLSRKCQKVSFLEKRRLLTVLSRSDEWGRLILMPRSSFSREKLIWKYRGKWCIPISFSGREKCVKGGVFFPISDLVFSGSGSVRIRSGQFCRIQAGLAYTC